MEDWLHFTLGYSVFYLHEDFPGQIMTPVVRSAWTLLQKFIGHVFTFTHSSADPVIQGTCSPVAREEAQCALREYATLIQEVSL